MSAMDKACPFCGDEYDKGSMEMFAPQTGAKWRKVTCRVCGASAPDTVWNQRAPEVNGERVAQLLAHRAVGNQEQDEANGKLAGYCAVCQIPWPCLYAGKPPVTLREIPPAAPKEGADELLREAKETILHLMGDAGYKELNPKLLFHIDAHLARVSTEGWRDHLESVVDIYFDGIENAPEDRAYVDGSFSKIMYESRALLAALPKGET